jgi:hypothetical protein
MDPVKCDSLSIMTKSVTGVCVSFDYPHPLYEGQEIDNPVTSKTGLLELYRILPKSISMPDFIFRWDHNENSVNVDIHGVTDAERDLFKKEKCGFRGHKTIRQDDGSYRFCIVIPSGTIAQGTIRLIANFGLRISDQMYAGD